MQVQFMESEVTNVRETLEKETKKVIVGLKETQKERRTVRVILIILSPFDSFFDFLLIMCVFI